MDQIKIGKFILQLRIENDMTQEVLATKLGVSNRTISRWENGKNMPDVSLFEPICQIFNISLEEFLLGERILHTSDLNIDSNIILEEYKNEIKQKKNKIINRISIIAIILLLLTTIGLFVASFLIPSVVYESVIMFDTPHYNISFITFNLAKASFVLFVLLISVFIINKKTKCNVMTASLIISLCVFIVFGIGFSIYVESNYEYEEPYMYNDFGTDGLKTDQHNPYEKHMKYYPFHDKMVNFAKESDSNDITDTNTEFSYIGYELFGTRLIWTNEYPWTDDEEYINYWFEYYCADNVLSKGYLQSLYVINMSSSNWDLVEETNDYQLYENNGDYMVVIVSSNDLLIQKIYSANTLEISKNEILSSALAIYKNENSK